MILLTELAAQKLQHFANEEGVPAAIRPCVRGGGCAGFTYDLTFVSPDDTDPNSDEIFTVFGVVIVVDPVSLQYLEGSTIDYEENKLGTSGFRFINPNSTGTCGCGNSFSA